MKPVALLASCVTIIAAEPAKRPTADELKAAALKVAVDVISTQDGTPQKVVYFQPDTAAKHLPGPPVPLLVFLHTWSGSIEQGLPVIGLARRLGWAMVAPDFRGPNDHPAAGASSSPRRTSSTRSTTPRATPVLTRIVSTSSAVRAAAICHSSWSPGLPSSGRL